MMGCGGFWVGCGGGGGVDGCDGVVMVILRSVLFYLVPWPRPEGVKPPSKSSRVGRDPKARPKIKRTNYR